MIINVAQKTESNFKTLNGLVAEMTETCTIARSREQTNQRVKSGRKEMYQQEGKEVEEKIQSTIEDRKKLIDDIIDAQKEFEKTVLEIPGALGVLSSTAGKRVMSAVKGAAKLFQNFSKNLMTFNLFGCFRTVRDALYDVADTIEECLTDDVVDDSDEPISYEDKRVKFEEEYEKEMKIYSRISSMKEIIKLLISLASKENLNSSEERTELWEMQDSLNFTFSALSKTTEVTKYAELDELVSSILDVCQEVSDETRFRGFHEEVRTKSLKKLDEVQRSLHAMSKKKNIKLILKLQKAVESLIQNPMLSRQGQGYLGQRYGQRYFCRNFFGYNRIENIQEELRDIQKKTGGTYRKIQQIISSLLNACGTLLKEPNKSHETVRDLKGTQQSLAKILKDMDSSIKTKREQLESLTTTSYQRQDKEYDVSQKRDIERMAKGQGLYFQWKRYDRQTENITEHYELQREIAETMSQLALDLIELKKTLDLMSRASTDLSNVRYKKLP